MTKILILIFLLLPSLSQAQGVGSPICSEIQEEGAFLTCSRKFNFVGDDITATAASGVTTVKATVKERWSLLSGVQGAPAD